MRSPGTILITGASSGIGAALASEYAGPGVHLALAGRNRQRLDAVANTCGIKGAHVTTASIEITDPEAMAAWIVAYDDKHPIDLVIANAAITSGVGPGRWRESMAAIKRVLAVNFEGVIHTIEPVLDRMRERGRGQIAIVSSLAGLRGVPYSPAYSATKAGLIAYGESMRGLMRSEGIEINIVLPGFVDTPLDDSVDSPKPMRQTPERAARIIRRGLARNRARIAFPTLLYWSVLLLRSLPQALTDPFMTRVPVEIPAPDTEPESIAKASGDSQEQP